MVCVGGLRRVVSRACCCCCVSNEVFCLGGDGWDVLGSDGCRKSDVANHMSRSPTLGDIYLYFRWLKQGSIGKTSWNRA